MKALLCPIGSRGDVEPQLVLGEELKRRGHQVELAAPPNFRAPAEARGFQFRPVGEDVNAFLLKHREMAEQNPLLALPSQIALLRTHTERQVRDLFQTPAVADIVVSAGLCFGGKIIADKLNVPHVFVCYTLSGMRSAAHPPAALPLFGLPAWGNRALWTLVTQFFDRALGGTLNRLRTEYGVRPERKHWESIHARNTLLAQDSAFGGELPKDTPGNALQIPALMAESNLGRLGQPLPDLLERFLRGAGDGSAQRTPLVYLGFGSMPSVDRARIIRIACELFEQHEIRVLLFSAHGEDAHAELPAGVFSLDEADHRLLFPKLDLVVHHGGAGTTAAALRAGVPQLIVPHIVDQFFHGKRIAELGLGPKPVAKQELSAELIAQAVKQRFQYWAKAQRIQAQLSGASGAQQAAEFLEQLALGKRAPFSS